jgi:hypothetical protein
MNYPETGIPRQMAISRELLRKHPDTALTSGTFLYEVINLDQPDVFEKSILFRA